MRDTYLTPREERIMYSPIGDTVKIWRIERGYTIEQLATKSQEFANAAGMSIKVSKSYISQLERNQIRKPGTQHLRVIAEALGITPHEILARRYPGESTLRERFENRGVTELYNYAIQMVNRARERVVEQEMVLKKFEEDLHEAERFQLLLFIWIEHNS